MKPPLRLLLALLIPLLCMRAATAQNAAGVRSFKDMLKDIPAKEILKLWGPKKVETAMAISNQLRVREVDKVGTYEGKVTKIDPYSFPNENVMGWRLGVEDSFKRGGDTLAVFSWVMVQTDPNGMIPKIRLGDEITVTGKVNRAELTATDAPRLNVDLIVPVMNNGKGTAAKPGMEKPVGKAAMPAGATPGAAAAAATAPAKEYPLDRILDALPETTRTRLLTAPLPPEAMMEVNTTLAKLAVNKPFKLTFAVADKGVVPGQPQNYRIRAASGLLSGKYQAVPLQWVHLYLPTEKSAEVAKAAMGDTITMTGTISRCDIIKSPQGLQFQVNMNDAQIVPQ